MYNVTEKYQELEYLIFVRASFYVQGPGGNFK